MAVRTYVSTSARADQLDEARQALGSLDPTPLGPVEVTRPDVSDALTGLSVSLSGDVRESVKQQLRTRSDLEYMVEVRDVDEE
ncbi:hypothetical protein [Streptomyces hokutonensis]|uniref:hypothetical protein n=1 Tax=Streptomyces hokutonensis TaxID=1306990 RepID=UPI00035FF71F|nr:hypothetical protein [Streptomyces hokutonensis]